MSNKADKDNEFNKQTVIVIDWMQKKGVSGCKTNVLGNKMPEKIKQMVAQQMIDELKVRFRIY